MAHTVVVRQGAALVWRGDDEVFSAVGGVANADGPVGEATRFQIASISKQFCCALVLRLAERGGLDVTDPITTWFDDVPDGWRPITVQHLMTHTAGLVHWPDLPQSIHTEPPTIDELVEMFMAAPLRSEPGATYYYSSPGYVLLALIAQRCGGRPYHDLLRDEVFVPVGMPSTFGGDRAPGGDVAAGYRDGEPTASMSLDVTDIGAGDIWSTVHDLMTWDRALVNGTFLSDASRREMLTPHVPMPDEVPGIEHDGYGYGWCIGRTQGHRIWYHAGGNYGYQSLNVVLPDDDACLTITTNDESDDFVALALDLLALVLEGAA
jgi:CubicO group peptidase (beta-lactamase class C family)